MNNGFSGVVIDAGHGGSDSGAVGNGILEKDLNLKISLYIHDRLDELGIPNQLVRTGDETIEPGDRVKKILSFYGDGNDVIVISNHNNAGGGQGSEIIYALRNSDELGNKIVYELNSIGRNVRKVYQRRYPTDYSKDYYFIHRNTGNTQPLIIEYGFVDNTIDANILKSDWQEYAEAVVRALCNYLGVPYIPNDEEIEGVYIVQKGDSLWSIAKKFNLTVAELKRINNLESNLLSIGQVLKLTDDQNEIISDDYYIVQKGDTLYSISKKYNISVDKLKDINNLNNNVLSIGQKIYLNANNMDDSDTEEQYDIYVVLKGDSLYSIANKYGISVDKLKDINNLSSDIISIGMKLLVPMKEANETYIVQKGDTLYSIARKYNVTVTDLIDLNNLTTSLLNVGDELKIPN